MNQIPTACCGQCGREVTEGRCVGKVWGSFLCELCFKLWRQGLLAPRDRAKLAA